ncbi:MAG: M20/M25/M40 family metallo-hydrolase [Armatimonadetes bacterium]|nr:M20/M25/M40 family metallo-hydrolase [Armatimonadota bacterium]
MTNRARLVESFLELCRINSPSLQEARVADHLRGLLEAMGLEVVRDRAHETIEGQCGNLFATLPGNAPGAEPLFLSAHMDTIEPNPDLVVVADDETLRSDGASILGADDKAGIAPILEALRVIIENKLPHGDIQVVFSISEETGLRGARYMDDSLLGPRCGFVLDTGPPVGTILTSAPAHDIIEATFTGRAAHAGIEPEKGVSAIQVAARAVDTMPLGRIDAETTANIGSIHGGQATNIVCGEVNLRAEARSRSAAKLEAQVQAMEAAMRAAADAYSATVAINRFNAYPGYVHSDDALPVRLAASAGASLGLPVSLAGGGGGSDANFLNQRGRCAVVLGTAMRAVHTHQEYVIIDELVASAEWLVAILREAART